jgi:hypothetical protein
VISNACEFAADSGAPKRPEVHADWDQDLPIDMTKTYFALLTGARYRRWVEIGEGTHSVMMEKNRMQLFRGSGISG